jgi:hypothetical protein
MKCPLEHPRVVAASLAALLLSGCGHMALLSVGAAKPAPAPPQAPAKPVCPGSLLADIPPFPPLPAGAGFPAPQDAAASAAVALYGQFLHSLAVYARQGWERASAAKDYCSTPR